MSRTSREWMLAVCVLIFGFSCSEAAFAVPQLLVDETSGEIVVARDSDILWHPASLTKLMTAHLAFEAIEQGRLTPDTPVVISQHAASMPPSKLGLPPGTSIPLDEALKVTLTRSMNDLATAIGETVANGPEADFVALMNAEAKRLGMISTRFTNASGLPDEAQVTTARDLALLAVAITRRHPSYEKYFSTQKLSYGSKVLKNTNTLLAKLPGTDGMKTGFVCSSGYNLINRITIRGHRYITVVMGAASVREREIMTGRMLSLVASGPVQGPPLRSGAALSTSVPDMSRYGCGKSYQAGKDLPTASVPISPATSFMDVSKSAPEPFTYGFMED